MSTGEKDTEEKKDEGSSQSQIWEEMRDDALLGHTQSEEEKTEDDQKKE